MFAGDPAEAPGTRSIYGDSRGLQGTAQDPWKLRETGFQSWTKQVRVGFRASRPEKKVRVQFKASNLEQIKLVISFTVNRFDASIFFLVFVVSIL